MKTIRILVSICLLLSVLCGCRKPIVRHDGGTLLSVECLSQMPDFPTGCESVTTVMALQYHGEAITTDDFIACHLPTSNDFYYRDGDLIGPDPNRFYVGDPSTQNGYGCFAPVIETALHHYFGSTERVLNTTGTSIPLLCQEYIDNGLPVILWAGIRMEPIKEGSRWLLENGERFVWPSGEHCVLLIGYNKTHYFINDPYTGDLCAYDKSTVEQRYDEMHRQSLVITQ